MSTYYPVGTIVKLSIDKDCFFMISGYLPRQDNQKVRDYFGVPFPLGLTKANQYILFDKNCITDVIHTGYCDEECQIVMKGFEQLLDNINNFISDVNKKREEDR